ncbi:MAG: DUF5919 domain-containing protein [Dermatophilaceae bacterium]
MTALWDSAVRDLLDHARRSAGGGAALANSLKEAGVGPDSGAYSESAVSNWIKGRTRPPADVVLAAAQRYNLSIDKALGLTSPSTAPAAPQGDALSGMRESITRLQVRMDALLAHQGAASTHTTKDVRAVFATRSEAQAAVPLVRSLAAAERIDMMGLSLNALCQGVSDVTLAELIENGLNVRCLFLDPDAAATVAREVEEGFPAKHLSDLTRTNMRAIDQVHERLSPEARSRLRVRTYDAHLRFNITIFDNHRCLVQLYLHEARGLDAPALLIENDDAEPHGLYPVFAQVFTSTWNQGRDVYS